MMEQGIARGGEFVMIGCFAAIMGVTLWRVLRGNNLRQMLMGSQADVASGRMRRHRLPLFVAALFGIAYYLGESLNGMATGAAPPRSLPDIPQSLLFLMAGSNGVYLTGKVAGLKLFGGDRT